MNGGGDATYLELGLTDLQEEILALPEIAGDLLDPRSLVVIEEARATLRSAVENPDKPFTWAVNRDRPILTGVSDGEYERKQGGKGQPVIGALSFLWHMKTGPAPVKKVSLIGNITTQIQLRDPEGDEDSFLSMWRMEMGDSASPGACFHAQVLGDSADPPFPSHLPVPRFPIFPPTPMTCLEFLLGELFQASWPERVERGTGEAQRWRGIQKRRFEAFLNWQQEAVRDTTGSALSALKRFPPAVVLSAAS
jgi:hypothetical protein